MNISDMCLLDILEREREAKNKMIFNGNALMNEHSRQNPNEAYCKLYTIRRDAALNELNEARRDLRMYCKYHGISYSGES